MNNQNIKTLIFYKFAQSIGAIEHISNLNETIDVDDLLFHSSIFLSKDKILTKKQELQYNLFKDNFNRYLKYCKDNNLVNKDKFQEIKYLNITTVPDMSKIIVPDISKELKEMDIDIAKLTSFFSRLSSC